MTSEAPTKPLAYFSVDLLFGEPLDFDLEEIAEAVSEDYPQASVLVHPVNTGKSVRTDKVILGMLMPKDSRNGHVVLMNGIGHPDEEFRNADHSDITWRSGGFAHCAREAIKSHQSYMTFSVQTTDHSLVGQFRAVRQLMAVSAVFAELPICLGVLVHWSSHMVAPGTWVDSARKAMRGQWPTNEWVSFRCGWDAKRTERGRHAVGYTKGLRNFLGFELHIAAAPIEPSDAKSLLKRACATILESGGAMQDGDTFSVGYDEPIYTVRLPVNPNGTKGSVMVLVHPDTPVNDSSEPAAKVATTTSDWRYNPNRPAPNFMKSLFEEHAIAS